MRARPSGSPLATHTHLAAATFVLAALLSGAVHASAAGHTRRVVILHGTEIFIPGGVQLEQTVRESLNDGSHDTIEFYSEALDAPRAGTLESEPLLVAYLQRKYEQRQPGVILIDNDTALAFIERHRARIWPDVPVVFCGISEETLAGKQLAPAVTGVAVKLDVAGTLDLALRLQPRTQRVVVVGGTSEYDRSLLARIRSEIERHPKRLRATYLNDLPLDEILARVAELSSDTIVLYATFFRDARGTGFVPRDVLQRLAKASSAPIYGLFDTYVGAGIVGGSIVSVEAQARRASHLALRILAGEAPSSIRVEGPPPPVPTVDGRELRRWKLSESALPPATIQRFRPSTLWSLYRRRIVAALVVVAAQSVLIAALLAQRRRFRLAELEAQRQRTDLAHAARLALVGELTASIAHEINQPLGAILSNSDAAEMLLDSGDPSPAELRQILADIRNDDLRASEVIRRVRDLARKRVLEREPLDISAVASDAVRLMKHEAERRELRLEAQLASSLPLVRGDRVHLQQVLLNLILNAMEAMASSPEVQRRLTVRTSWNGNGEVEVAVTDRGPGIASEHLDHLFDSFFTTKKRGVGLGLSIARSIVAAHGGRIWAESDPGYGATFRLALPAGEINRRGAKEA